jgi:murein DD-endopeptidase
VIRTTADDLYKRVFTVVGPKEGTTRAAFFVDGKGTACHVAGIVGEGIALNSQEGGAKIMRLESLGTWFRNKGCSMEVRGLNRCVLAALAKDVTMRTTLDKEFGEFFSF